MDATKERERIREEKARIMESRNRSRSRSPSRSKVDDKDGRDNSSDEDRHPKRSRKNYSDEENSDSDIKHKRKSRNDIEEDKQSERDRDRERRERDRRERERDIERDHKRDRNRDRDYRRDRDRNRNENRSREDEPRRSRRDEESKNKKNEDVTTKIKPEIISGRAGGVYIPPFKLAEMMNEVQDKSSADYQRMTWEALKKSINGLVNKVSITNIKNIIPELFYENLIRGRGLFCRSIMKAQAASPAFTPVYAALVAVVNTKMPEVGELLVKRLVLQFRKAYDRNNKSVCVASNQFLAHLSNQLVVGVMVSLQIAALLLEKPTDDTVEVAVSFLTECGAMLNDTSPIALNQIFDRFRAILHEGEIDKRVQYTIELLFATRKSNFNEHPAIKSELDLVEADDQITHDDISLSDKLDPEDKLNFFHFDENFLENEEKYDAIRRDLLGDEAIDELEGREGEDGDDEDEEEGENGGTGGNMDENAQKSGGMDGQVIDQTETDLVNLRRTIYLTIMSSLDFNDCAHKLRKIQLPPGQEMELCNMIIECASQERTYMRFYGLLGARFCNLEKVYQDNFDKAFNAQYSTIHRLETNKLRNVAKFFAHLLHSDAINWSCLSYIHLNEDETTSSSRIFVKIVFQELAEYLGLPKLNTRLKDKFMQPYFEGIFPRDNPKNTRFAINFFTSIGLGGLTDELREFLKTAPKIVVKEESDSDSDSDSSSDSSSDSDSSSSSSDFDEDAKRRKKAMLMRKK